MFQVLIGKFRHCYDEFHANKKPLFLKVGQGVSGGGGPHVFTVLIFPASKQIEIWDAGKAPSAYNYIAAYVLHKCLNNYTVTYFETGVQGDHEKQLSEQKQVKTRKVLYEYVLSNLDLSHCIFTLCSKIRAS